MKPNKILPLLALLALAVVLGSCKKDPKVKNLKQVSFAVAKADISNAVALTLCTKDDTKATRADDDDSVAGLYKVDENGNLSYVIFYFEVQTDTTGKETKTAKELNLALIPTWIMPYGKDFILLGGCVGEYKGDLSSLPQNMQAAVDAFCGCGTVYRCDDGIYSVQQRSIPGYWLLLRKSDGKLFDISGSMYYDWSSATPSPLYFPTPYPNLKETVDIIRDRRNNGFNDEYIFHYVNIEREGYLHEVGDNLYVTANYISRSDNCIAKVSSEGDNLIVSELTNSKLCFGKEGFLVNSDGLFLSQTGTKDMADQVMIIDRKGEMVALQDNSIRWQNIFQVGDKWYAGLGSRINPDGSITPVTIKYPNDDNQYFIQDRSRLTKYNPDAKTSVLAVFQHQDSEVLCILTIDSEADEIRISSFPADFPTDYDLYGSDGVAYILSDDIKSISSYDISTGGSRTYSTDLSAIPSFVLPTQTYDAENKRFLVNAYHGQDNISFYIDAVTGKADLLGTATGSLHTTTFVPLN